MNEVRYTPPLGDRAPTLFGKIAEIQGAIGGIEPDAEMEISGRAAKYRYVSESKLLSAIRPLLAEHKVAAFVSTDSQHTELVGITKKDGKPGTVQLSTVTMSITFADGESAETFTVFSQGAATDYGDKAVYKAITSANRYMWWKAMLIGTDGDDGAATESDYTLAQQQTGQTPTGAAADVQQPTAASAAKPTPASKKLTSNLLAECKALDPTRDYVNIIDEWILTWSEGRGLAELTQAERNRVNYKLEKTRDALVAGGAEVGSIGGEDVAAEILAEEGLLEESNAALSGTSIHDQKETD